MISLSSSGSAHCDNPGCQHATAGKFVLMRGGGFGFTPNAHGWQFGGDGGAFQARCPEHHVAPPPAPEVKPEDASPAAETAPEPTGEVAHEASL